MTNVIEILKSGDLTKVDWTDNYWRALCPILKWLGFSVLTDVGKPNDDALVDDELEKYICSEIIEIFKRGDDSYSWSSQMITDAFTLVHKCFGSPEPLLLAFWRDFSNHRGLEKLVYELCKAIGISAKCDFPSFDKWNLEWTLRPGNGSQLCLRYFVLSRAPTLCSEKVVSETVQALKKYPFDF